MDAFNFPGDWRGQMFWPSSVTGATTGWQTFTIPREAEWLYIMAISGGGGGGGGFGAAGGSGKGGGGGGGSSGISRYLFPAWLLKQQSGGRLYVLVGNGGIGGAGGSSGGGQGGATCSGQLSYVAIWPNTTVQNLLAVSGAAAPVGGTAGTATTATGGAAGTIATAAGAVLGQWALGQNFIAGIIGGAGGTGAGNTAGSAVAFGTGCPILSGAGGAGSLNSTAVGGAISAVANTPFIGVAGGAPGTAGSSGFWFKPYPVFYGGTGGGASNTVTGGAGGNGVAPGTGGGGGAGGVTVGGAGGAGGPGLVAIQWW